jgi:hypothetical protein
MIKQRWDRFLFYINGSSIRVLNLENKTHRVKPKTVQLVCVASQSEYQEKTTDLLQVIDNLCSIMLSSLIPEVVFQLLKV